jgi:hypothetical protein
VRSVTPMKCREDTEKDKTDALEKDNMISERLS